ncbi:MAG: flagellar hook-basal body complex protein FliE [Bacteriovoracaceae bacterium]
MAIKNVSEFQKMFNNYNTTDWVKSKSFDDYFNEIGDGLDNVSKSNGSSFSSILESKLDSLNGLQQDANLAVQKLVTGKTKNIHETLFAVERAEIAFKTMHKIRNKVLDAYKEVMRMQI